MTIGGNTPYGPGAELPQPNQPAPGMFPPPGGQSGPWPLQPAPAAPRRGGLATAGIAASLALASAALVVGGIALARHPATTAAGSTSTSASPIDTSASDKALCTAVAPALADSDKVTNAYVNLGKPGSPERDAALPKFVDDTKDWVKRGQEALDAHPDAQGYLRRSLQRYLDDFRLLTDGLRPGQLKPYNEQMYSDSNSAYNGPLTVCSHLGVKW